MFRIRFHGRGGQGMKTGSRILGTALFRSGYEVQDAPRYGAERRGAPIFAYVRAARGPIYERGVIGDPNLVVVADDSLLELPAIDVLGGVDSRRTVVVVNTHQPLDAIADRFGIQRQLIVALPAIAGREQPRLLGVRCAGAAARLIGVESEALAEAVTEELGSLGRDAIASSVECAALSYKELSCEPGRLVDVAHHPPVRRPAPPWIEVPREPAAISAPVIRATRTSAANATGLWRTSRPAIDTERCHGCWWICATFCPDNTITVDQDGRPHIDYQHCKGCLVCLTHCPNEAISATPERTGELREPARGEV